MADLILKNIQKSYGSNKVIHNLDLTIKDGEFVTLLGPSGCGKTTLLRMIAGLETIDKGSLTIGGKDMTNLPAQKRPIGMVFQSYALFPHMNVRNNITFGLKIQKKDEATIFEKLDWVIPLLGLEGLEERLPKEISGGQRQRVALARALVLDPEVLLLDEPLSNLDAALRELAMEELKRIHKEVGKTIIYVSHNQAEAMSMSQRIAVMNGGDVEQYAEPMHLYDNPETRFVAEFIGSPIANSFHGVVDIVEGKGRVETSLGTIIFSSNIDDYPSIKNGTEVTVCIRPQDIHLYKNQILDANSTHFDIIPSMVETPGDRSMVIGVDDAGETIRFFFNRINNIEVGKSVSVFVDAQHVHVFDVKSNKNLKENATCDS